MKYSTRPFQTLNRNSGDARRIRKFFGLSLAASALLICSLPVDAEDNDAASAMAFDPAKVVGLTEGKCKQCHPSEVAQWEKTTHAISTRRLEYKENTKKYADALGISEASLTKDSACAKCHSTRSSAGGAASAISGVSCESCHGPAKDWNDKHWKYTDDLKFTTIAALREARKEESDDHREARLASMKEAGMIRPAGIDRLANNCLSCHIVNDEKLIAAGHKAASAFELVSWTTGEVRHNFFLDENTNAKAPTLWMERQGKSAEERERVKVVVGLLTQIERSLRARAEATNPVVIPQIGGSIAAANGKLALISGNAPTAESAAVSATVAPMLGLIFAPTPTDKQTYSAAADKVAEQIASFLKSHDGSKLSGLDGLIQMSPPHYSQQYKQKYSTP